MFRAFLMGVTLTIGLILSVVNYRNDDMQGFAGSFGLFLAPTIFCLGIAVGYHEGCYKKSIWGTCDD